jgi:disulfide bond formation protein DsbB
MTRRAAVTLNALALYAISAVLLVAFYWQFVGGELPCPLCLLQRVAFAALAVGPALAVRHGPRLQYLGLVIVAALAGALISGRQMLLHIQPGDAGYGSTLMGLHFYTWAFIAFAGALLASGLMAVFGPQGDGQEPAPKRGLFENIAVWLVFGLIALNAASVLLQCGFTGCPANPVRYELLG